MTTGTTTAGMLSAAPDGRGWPFRAPERTWAFPWLLAFLAILFLRPGELIPALAPLRLALLAFAISGALFLVQQRRLELFSHPTPRWMLAYALAMFISVPASFWPAKGIENVTIYLRMIATFMMVFYLARSAAAWRRIVAVLVVSQAVTAVYAIATYLEDSEERIVGLGGMFSDPNDMALNIILTFPLAWWLKSTSRSAVVRLALWGALGLFVGGVLASQSRGGLLAMSLVIPLTLWQDRGRRTLLFLGLFAGAGAVIVFAPSRMLDRFRTISTYNQDESAQIRLALWQAAGQMIKDRPLHGVGTGAFVMAYGERYRTQSVGGGMWRAAHNTYLETAAEVGLFGFVCWLMLLVSAYAAMRRRQRQLLELGVPRSALDFPRAVMIAMAGYLVGAMFLSRGLDWVLTVLLALGAGWCFTPLDRYGDAPRWMRPASLPQENR